MNNVYDGFWKISCMVKNYAHLIFKFFLPAYYFMTRMPPKYCSSAPVCKTIINNI